MLVNLGFHLEHLKPIIQLLLNFQKEKIDTVSAATAFGKVKEKLRKLKNKYVNDFKQIKTVKNYIKELEDGKIEYKTICLKNLEAELETCEQKKNKEKEQTQDAINSHLEENDSEFIVPIFHILSYESWEQRNAKGDIDLEFCDQHLIHIINRLEKLFKNAEFETCRCNWRMAWFDFLFNSLFKLLKNKLFAHLSSYSQFKKMKNWLQKYSLCRELAFCLPLSKAKLDA